MLAAILALSSADVVTVGASATQLRNDLSINNTDIGLLVAVSSLVGALASVPFGVLADRVRRTFILGAAIVLWGVAMVWSAMASSFGELLLTRLFLGSVTAAAGPLVASLVGDYFAGSGSRITAQASTKAGIARMKKASRQDRAAISPVTAKPKPAPSSSPLRMKP